MDKYVKDNANTLKMSKRVVNIGSSPNDGTGDSLRDGMDKINQNFAEIYESFGDGSILDITQVINIENATTLNGQDGFYYLNYNNFINTPTDLSSFNNSVGFITSFTDTNYWSETLVGIHTLSNVGIGTTNAIDKLTVLGGDISVGINTSDGLILTSPNGTRYRLIVSNDGSLSTVVA